MPGEYQDHPLSPSHNATPPGAGGVSSMPDEAWCAGCGYALAGLNIDGVCPECGMPIRRSLSRELLRDAGPHYVRTLARGAVMVLISLIGTAVLTAGSVLVIGLGVFGGMSGAGATPYSAGGLNLLLVILQFLISLIGLYGWWLLSSPDPRQGSQQQGSARRVLRAALVILAGSYLLSIIVNMFMVGGGGAAPNLTSGLMIASMLVGIISLGAWVTMFVAAMLFLKGLARRIPDPVVERRAQTYTWLLPLIYVLGMCILVGPLIAMVMYAVLMLRVWKDMKAVLWEQNAITAAQQV